MTSDADLQEHYVSATGHRCWRGEAGSIRKFRIEWWERDFSVPGEDGSDDFLDRYTPYRPNNGEYLWSTGPYNLNAEIGCHIY